MAIKVGIIGGTGFADAHSEKTVGTMQQVETPFGLPSSPVLETTFADVPVAGRPAKFRPIGPRARTERQQQTTDNCDA